MKQEEIKKICDWHNVDPEGVWQINEDWLVSRTGDLIGGRNFGYGIYDYQNGDTWIPHMAEKNWVDLHTFIPAYVEALCRRGYKEYTIKLSYDSESITIKPFELRTDFEGMNELANKAYDMVNNYYRGMAE